MGASLEPFSQTHTLLHLDVIMLLLLGYAFLTCGPIQLWTWMTRITHLMMDDLMSFDFLTYHTYDAILGHIFVSIEIYRSSWSCMIISTNEIHVEMMTFLLSYHDPLVEPFWSHPIKPTFFRHLVVICFSF